MSDDDDPYQVLGVGDGVTPTDLKRAYFLKIREHPPESDPEGYQRVQRAYQTATDPEYPIRREHGKEIDASMEEVDGLMEKGEYSAAIRPLKKVLLLQPGLLIARNKLGLCQIRTAEWEAAKRTFAKLVGQKPDSALYRVNYAWVFISQANSMERNPEAEAKLAGEARAQLDVAQKLEPQNPSVLLAYAKSYDAQAAWPEAIEWAEKAAAARKSLDIDDYEYLTKLHVYADHVSVVVGVADRLADLLTDEGKEAAAGYFAKKAVEFHEQHMFSLAHAFILVADRLHPDNPNISALCDQWVNALEAKSEYQRMKDDKEMNPAVRYLCVIYIDRTLGLKFDRPIEELFGEVKEALDTWDAHELAAAARRVQRKYQAVYRLVPDLFDEMAGEKASKSARRYPSRSRGPAPSPSPSPPAPPIAPPPPPVRDRPVEPPPPRPLPVSRPAPPRIDDSRDANPAGESAPHRGWKILLLGILSLMCCFPVGFFALVMGSSDLTKMDRGDMNPKGRGLTIAGMVISGFGLLFGFINIIRIINAR